MLNRRKKIKYKLEYKKDYVILTVGRRKSKILYEHLNSVLAML